MKTGTMAVSSIILYLLISTFINELLLPMPTFESAPFGNFGTGNETEMAPSWEFRWRNFTEHAQNFWNIFAPLCVMPIGIFTLLMVQYLLYCKPRRSWHRREGAENELSQLRQLIQDGETFMLESREELACMQKMESECCRHIQSEVCSVMQMVRIEDEQCAQLWNEMRSLNEIMILRDKCYAHLQNEMKSLKMMVKEDEKCHAKMLNEMCSLQIMMLKAEKSELDSAKKAMMGSSLMTVEQMSGDPALMVSPVKIETCRKNDILACKTTGEKEEEPISKAWVCLAPPPYLGAVRRSVGSVSNTGHKPGKGHVKLRNQKPDFSKTQARVNTWRRK
jgi:hypothetical protein